MATVQVLQPGISPAVLTGKIVHTRWKNCSVGDALLESSAFGNHGSVVGDANASLSLWRSCKMLRQTAIQNAKVRRPRQVINAAVGPSEGQQYNDMSETASLSRKETKADTLRKLLRGDAIVQGPCCYDALGARLVEAAGFPLVVMSGFSVSASRLGMPDTGLLSYGEMVDQSQLIASAVDIPLIADADTGYGNVLNVKRTVRGYQQAGVAALIIEDQAWPKACGHTRGRQVVLREEAVTRIRAAVDARDELPGDILVVARSDARQAVSLDEAIWRAQAFADAGADMVFVDALGSREDMAAFCRAVPHTPKMANMLEGGVTPVLPPLELQDLGFSLVVYPLSLLGVTMRAMQDALLALKSGRLPPPSVLPSFEEIKSVVGFDQYYEEEDRYTTFHAGLSRSAESEAQSTTVSSSAPGVEKATTDQNVRSNGLDPAIDDVEIDGSGQLSSPKPRDGDEAVTCMGDFECDDEAPPGQMSPGADWYDGNSTSTTKGQESFSSGSVESTSQPLKAAFPNQSPTRTQPPASPPPTSPPPVAATSSQVLPADRPNQDQPIRVVEAEVLTNGPANSSSSGSSSSSSDFDSSSSGSQARSEAFSSVGGLWSRTLRVRVSDSRGASKLDFRIPAGFLDGLAGTIPAVAGVNLKALLDDRLRQNFTGDAQPLLDVTDRTGTGDRVQIFLE